MDAEVSVLQDLGLKPGKEREGPGCSNARPTSGGLKWTWTQRRALGFP